MGACIASILIICTAIVGGILLFIEDKKRKTYRSLSTQKLPQTFGGLGKDVEERFFSPSDTMDLEEVRLRLHEMVDKEYASS